MPHVLVVSTPFRAPWHTDDYETNKSRAVWAQADESMLYPHVDTFQQYNTRPRSSEVRALCWCSGNAARDEAVDWQKIDVDMAAYNARRVFRDHDMLHDFMREYAACAGSRPDLFENESAALAAWRDAFVQNSIAFAAENKAHAELVAQQDAPAADESSNKRQRTVRFSDKT